MDACKLWMQLLDRHDCRVLGRGAASCWSGSLGTLLGQGLLQGLGGLNFA